MKKLLGLALAGASVSAYADGAVAPAAGQPSMLPSLGILVVFFLFLYFVFIRPQSKRNKEQQRVIASVEKGDEIISIAGLYGKVVAVDATTLDIEIAKGIVIKMQRQSVASLIPKGTISTVKSDDSEAAVPAAKKAKTVKKAK